MPAERRELIREALAKRLGELSSEGITPPAAFDYGARASWLASEGDGLAALANLSQGGRLPVKEAEGGPPAAGPFLEELRARRREPLRQFELLLERYACPLNISAGSESEVREHLLESLMVQGRARLEKSPGEIPSGELLLKLNLLAVHAGVSADLRYLDALNYYYELLHERCKREAPALYLSYTRLYARALSAWIERNISGSES